MAKHGIPLPTLAFGVSDAFEDLDIDIMSERLSANGASTTEYWQPEPAGAFRSVSALTRVGTLRMVANSCTSAAFRAANPANAILMMPLAGSGFLDQDKRRVAWDAETAAYLPAMDSHGAFSERSVVGIDIVPALLEPLACRMLDRDPGGRPILDLEEPRQLRLASGSIRFNNVFRHLMLALDQCMPVAAIRDRSGLDDAIHRAVIMLMKPQHFINDKSSKKPQSAKLGNTCDYICAHLDQKITMSTLEAVSGLSARVLQYAFRDRYGCSPMQWVSEQRLDVVRRLMLAAPPGTKVSAIASQYFNNFGEFSYKYKTKYGELPSETLSARRRR